MLQSDVAFSLNESARENKKSTILQKKNNYMFQITLLLKKFCLKSEKFEKKIIIQFIS